MSGTWWIGTDGTNQSFVGDMAVVLFDTEARTPAEVWSRMYGYHALGSLAASLAGKQPLITADRKLDAALVDGLPAAVSLDVDSAVTSDGTNPVSGAAVHAALAAATSTSRIGTVPDDTRDFFTVEESASGFVAHKNPPLTDGSTSNANVVTGNTYTYNGQTMVFNSTSFGTGTSGTGGIDLGARYSDVTGDFTISALVKPTAGAGNIGIMGNREIVGENNETSGVYYGITPTGQSYFELENAHVDSGATSGIVGWDGSVDYGEWAWVMLTYDGLSSRLYHDGVIIKNVTIDSTRHIQQPDMSGTWWIGAGWNGGTRSFSFVGDMAVVLFDTEARTPAEVWSRMYGYHALGNLAASLAGKQPLITADRKLDAALVDGLAASLAGKQPLITADSKLDAALVDGLAASLEVDSAVTSGGTNPVSGAGVHAAIQASAGVTRTEPAGFDEWKSRVDNPDAVAAASASNEWVRTAPVLAYDTQLVSGMSLRRRRINRENYGTAASDIAGSTLDITGGRGNVYRNTVYLGSHDLEDPAEMTLFEYNAMRRAETVPNVIMPHSLYTGGAASGMDGQVEVKINGNLTVGGTISGEWAMERGIGWLRNWAANVGKLVGSDKPAQTVDAFEGMLEPTNILADEADRLVGNVPDEARDAVGFVKPSHQHLVSGTSYAKRSGVDPNFANQMVYNLNEAVFQVRDALLPLHTVLTCSDIQGSVRKRLETLLRLIRYSSTSKTLLVKTLHDELNATDPLDPDDVGAISAVAHMWNAIEDEGGFVGPAQAFPREPDCRVNLCRAIRAHASLRQWHGGSASQVWSVADFQASLGSVSHASPVPSMTASLPVADAAGASVRTSTVPHRSHWPTGPVRSTVGPALSTTPSWWRR